MNQAEARNRWWHKLDPLITTFGQRCRTRWVPGTRVSLDEMIWFYDRSLRTYRFLRNQPRVQNVGFVRTRLPLKLSSRVHGTGEFQKHKELTPTGSMVLQFAEMLPVEVESPLSNLHRQTFFNIRQSLSSSSAEGQRRMRYDKTGPRSSFCQYWLALKDKRVITKHPVGNTLACAVGKRRCVGPTSMLF